MIKEKTVVLVRTYSAGVHVGMLVKREGKEVELADARRIWYWKGANTLNEIALKGVGAGSKISDPVATIMLTEAIELIPVTDEALKAIEKAGWAS